MVRRTGIRVHGRWRIEYHTVDDSIAGKSGYFLLFSIVRVLIHIDKHVVTGCVGAVMRESVILIGACVFGGRRTRMARPLHDCLARIFPAACTRLEVTSAAKWNFLCTASQPQPSPTTKRVYSISLKFKRKPHDYVMQINL